MDTSVNTSLWEVSYHFFPVHDPTSLRLIDFPGICTEWFFNENNAPRSQRKWKKDENKTRKQDWHNQEQETGASEK